MPRNTGVMKCRAEGFCKTAATVLPFAITSDTQCSVCQGHILLGLYIVYCLSGTHFTGTVHSVLSVRDTIYRNCTQCTVCQGHVLVGLYTAYCLSGTHFTGTIHSVLAVRDTIYRNCT